MGLESAPQNPLGRIDVNQLVRPASEVVTPNAVAHMTDAFRQGAITADDIIARVGERGKLKEKADVQLLQEQTSPEAQSARKGMTHLVQSETDAKEAQIKYGPAIQYFQQFAPEAGIPAPVTRDGRPDYAQMAEIGSQLYNWKIQKQTALDRLTPTEWKEGLQNGQKVLLKFNKAGELISPELENELHQRAMAPFSSVRPGATAAPAAPAAPAAAPAAPAANPGYTAPAATQAEAVSRDQQLSQLLPNAVQPKAAPPIAPAPSVSPAPAAKPVIQPSQVGSKIPGVGISLGTNEKEEKEAAKTAEELATNSQLKESVAEARKLLTSSNVVGPGIGSKVGQIGIQIGAIFGATNDQYDSQQKLNQLINKKVLEGAQAMKGNLSDKDVRFLKDSFPSLESSEKVWGDYLDNWSRMIDLNDQVLRGVSPKGASIFDQATSTSQSTVVAPVAPAATQGSSGPVVTLATGRKVQRDASGQYHVVP